MPPHLERSSAPEIKRMKNETRLSPGRYSCLGKRRDSKGECQQSGREHFDTTVQTLTRQQRRSRAWGRYRLIYRTWCSEHSSNTRRKLAILRRVVSCQLVCDGSSTSWTFKARPVPTQLEGCIDRLPASAFEGLRVAGIIVMGKSGSK